MRNAGALLADGRPVPVGLLKPQRLTRPSGDRCHRVLMSTTSPRVSGSSRKAPRIPHSSTFAKRFVVRTTRSRVGDISKTCTARIALAMRRRCDIPRGMTLLSIDIDGVLHDLDTAYSVNDSRQPIAELLAAGLFAQAQALEDVLARHQAVKILVHSSWRLACTPDRIRELLGPLGHRMRGVTSPSITAREASILARLRTWRVPRHRLVILDDEPKLFHELRDRVVACEPDVGVVGLLDQLNAALTRAAA